MQEYLRAIAADTIATIKRGFYYWGNERVSILRRVNESIDKTVYYDHEEIGQLLLDNEFLDHVDPTEETIVEVVNETSNEGLYRLTRQGETNVMVLNFASAKKPGGGFINGKQAQEECLARTSTLYPTLLAKPQLYADNAAFDNEMYLNSMIYSPGVLFLKDDYGNYIKPVEAAVLTSAAPNLSKLDNVDYTNSQYRDLLYDRIHAMLIIAMEQEHDVLLLGAWGCGVFRNDPATVAGIFNTVLLRFSGYFKRIVFSVYDNKEDEGYPVFTPFHDEFVGSNELPDLELDFEL